MHFAVGNSSEHLFTKRPCVQLLLAWNQCNGIRSFSNSAICGPTHSNRLKVLFVTWPTVLRLIISPLKFTYKLFSPASLLLLILLLFRSSLCSCFSSSPPSVSSSCSYALFSVDSYCSYVASGWQQIGSHPWDISFEQPSKCVAFS